MLFRSLSITPKYAAILSLEYMYLTYRVISYRRGNKISLGVTKKDDPKGSEDLERRVRSHSNFSEFTPLALLLFSFIEVNDGNKTLFVHCLCATFLLGRTLHAYGLTNSVIFCRVGGMVMTIVSMSTASIYLLTS